MPQCCPLIDKMSKRYDLTRFFFAALMAAALLVFLSFVVIAFIPGMFCCQYDEQLEVIAQRAALQNIPSNVIDAKAESGFIEWVRGTAWVQVTVTGRHENGTTFLAYFQIRIDRKRGTVLEVRKVPR